MKTDTNSTNRIGEPGLPVSKLSSALFTLFGVQNCWFFLLTVCPLPSLGQSLILLLQEINWNKAGEEIIGALNEEEKYNTSKELKP